MPKRKSLSGPERWIWARKIHSSKVAHLAGKKGRKFLSLAKIESMTLIKSISGIRGTIGGKPEENLTPIDAVKFAAAYGTYIRSQSADDKLTIVIGRDARLSGSMIQNLVVNTLIGMGIDVIDLDLSTTPTVEMAVVEQQAQGDYPHGEP